MFRLKATPDSSTCHRRRRRRRVVPLHPTMTLPLAATATHKDTNIGVSCSFTTIYAQGDR